MSLEKTIAENTAAIRELIGIMQGARVTAPVASAEAVSPPVVVVDGSPDASIDYVKEIQTLVNVLVKNGKKAKAVEVRAAMGLSDTQKFSDLKPNQYAKCVELLKKAAQ